MINAVEKGETLVVSGSTSGVEAGQTVTVTFGGKNYTTTVESNGSWTVNVPPADLALRYRTARATCRRASAILTATAPRRIARIALMPPRRLLPSTPSPATIFLTPPKRASALTISGTSTAEAGQTVTVTLNGVNYSGNVQADGSWSVSVPTAPPAI